MKGWFSVAGCQLAVVLACGQERHYPLNDGWSFRQAGREQWRSAKVPGVVQTDLLRHGLIPDFMLGSNIDSVQWIEHEDWEYRRTLFVHDTLLRHEHLDLVFKGLDTFAEVYLNDSLIGTADNMFRTWEWDIRDAIRKGGNELKVIFRSPNKEGAKLREAYGIQLPHDSDPSGVSPYIRKAAYQFGWDFCPRLVTSGIWKEVELRGWSALRLKGITTILKATESESSIAVIPDIFPLPFGDFTVEAKIDGKRVSKLEWKQHEPVPWFKVPASSRMQWFPRGEGRRGRHSVAMTIKEGKRVVAHHERPISWRTIELDTTADEAGKRFALKVNGKSVFVRGANVIPPRLIPSEITDADWLLIVKQAVDLNMNMLRVWAGGIYPPESFFTACDTAGIMVWQDLMFAQMAPLDDEAILKAQMEAVHAMEGFHGHPSLVIWCGNNELEVAWRHWGWQARYGLHGADSARVWNGHKKFFHGPLLSRVANNLGQAAFVPTTPFSNWGNAKGLTEGDLHYWGVWHDDSTFSSFKNNVGRFVSEWGFQSYPDSALLAKYIAPDSLYLGSPAVTRLQRSYKTDRPIWEAIKRELGEEGPTSLGGFFAASQRTQATAYGMAIEAHMAARPQCMGTLLWQLNDCWPGPSWSIVDYGGHPKPAYYVVKEAFTKP